MTEKPDDEYLKKIVSGVSERAAKTTPSPRKTLRKITAVAIPMEPYRWYLGTLAKVQKRSNQRSGMDYLSVEFDVRVGDSARRVPIFVDDDPSAPRYQELLASLMSRELMVGDDAELAPFIGASILVFVIPGRGHGQYKIDRVLALGANPDPAPWEYFED